MSKTKAKTVRNKKFGINSITIDKATKAVIATRTADGWKDSTGAIVSNDDNAWYALHRKDAQFIQPTNAKGIARLTKKYAEKFPDLVAVISTLEVAQKFDKAKTEVVAMESKSPVVVELDNPKATGKHKPAKTELIFKKNGDIDTRYKYIDGLVEAHNASLVKA